MKKSLKIFISLLLTCVSINAIADENVIKVSDFGAFPDDGKCDIKAIAAAVAQAKAKNITTIKFDKGVYELQIERIPRDMGIYIKDFSNLALIGETDDDGKPATVLLRKYEFQPNLAGTQILRIDNCPNLKFKNFVFDNSPRYMTSGEVVENDGENVIIKIFEGNSFFDKTVLWCTNIWNPKTKNLKKVGSVTFGSTNVSARMDKLTAYIYGNPKDRLLKVSCEDVAKATQKGDYISWNFGWLGVQTLFYKCDNMHIENVTTHSAIGFCMQTASCKNVYGKKVEFRRIGNNLQVGSRDAWKLLRCQGDALIEDCYFEGVRWDAQNVHGIFVWPIEKTSGKSAKFSNHLHAPKAKDFPLGTKIGFCKNRTDEVMLTIKSVKDLTQKTSKGLAIVEIEFEEDIPDFVNKTTLCNVYGQNLNSYTLRNSHFKNIAGTASLIRNDNVTIENNLFEDIMYPAICVGGAMDEVEGVQCKNAKIIKNTFRDCTWQSRHGGVGAVSIRIQHTKATPLEGTPFIKNVLIDSNKFYNCPVPIDAQEVVNLVITNNKFEGTKIPTGIDEKLNISATIKNNSVK